MCCNLIETAPFESQNSLYLSLQESFLSFQPTLKPPFPLSIPTPQHYLHLNRALLFAILTQPHLSITHLKHLHAIVTDSYSFFTSSLADIVNQFYFKLRPSPKRQLLWLVTQLTHVSAQGLDALLFSLLRRIKGADFGDDNLLLCSQMLTLFLENWDCLLEEYPFVLTSGFYAFLRLLSDHCRVVDDRRVETVRRLEMEFCVKMLRERFDLCFKIGRDVIRLLLDLVHVPELREVWRDLVLNPASFNTPGFSDISDIYKSRTSTKYFLLRISPEMETQLRFLLTYVKLGGQKRHQVWFANKFLSGPEKETILIDIVRFICCAHHPSNDIIQSDVIPRWAVIGWLLKLCRKSYIECNVKLALFYDWLFFDERVDNIMDTEPAMLLMVCSIPQYMDITHSLLEYLFLLVDNYDVDRRDVIARGVSSAFSELVRKGVVSSLDVLTLCPALAPFLRQKLLKLLSTPTKKILDNLKAVHLPDHPMPLSESCVRTPTRSPEKNYSSRTEESGHIIREVEVSSVLSSHDSRLSHCSSVPTNKSQVEVIGILVQSLGESLKQSSTSGMQTLKTILVSLIHLDNQKEASGLISPEELSSKIAKEYETAGYRLFAPLKLHLYASDSDDEVGSVTALIIRTFIFSPQDRMLQMLFSWSCMRFQVGARILSYASRIAFEANLAGYWGNDMNESGSLKTSNSSLRLLGFHIVGHLSSLDREKDGLSGTSSSTPEMDKKSAAKLAEEAFSAYRSFLMYAKALLHKETDTSLSNLLYTDLKSCCEWGRKSMKQIFSGIFIHLPDLCIGEEDIIRLLVDQFDDADLVNIHFDIRLKKFSVFGEDTDVIFSLIKKSVRWDLMEKHKLWGLIRSELAVSSVQVEKLLLKFFCCDDLVANPNAIAVEGLLALLSCRAPTPELVGAITLLPNNVVQDFAPAVLGSWAASNASMLVESFAKILEKLENENKDLIISGSSGFVMNQSAICWFLNYFNSKGIDVSDLLRCFTVDVPS